MKIEIPTRLTDTELVAEVKRLVIREHDATAHLVAHLAEIDARELYLGAGFSSLYSYCHEGLGYTEDAAYNRKTAAQVARRFPAVLDMLAGGRLSLTGVRLLAPVLSDENHREAFAAAARKSKREVAELVSCLDPKPDVPPSIRKLPVAPPAAVPERERGQIGLTMSDANPAAGAPGPVTAMPAAARRPGRGGEKARPHLEAAPRPRLQSGVTVHAGRSTPGGVAA